MRDALVIVPTYDERKNLQPLVQQILNQSERLEVLVIDDASPDGTGEIAEALANDDERVHVIHRPRKLGLGTAYIDGFRFALGHSYKLVFEMDADFSHDPRHLPEFLELADDFDVVIGSRYTRGVTVVNWPMGRLLLSWLANAYARTVTGLPLNDLTSGFKCYRRKVLETIDLDNIHSTGYAFQIETVFRADRAGFRLVEIPIVFVDRNVGSSKMNRAIVWEAIWMVWRMRLWRITHSLDRS